MQIMAKGVLNNIDLGEQTPNLSYEGIQKFNPIQRQVPKMGTLKKVLSASKESESVSPYKKSAPKPVEIKTAKPSMLPVEQVSPITTNVLEPVTRISEPAAPVIQTATPSPIPVASKPMITEDVLSPIQTISQEDNAKVRTAVKNLADRAYSGEKTPLYPRDVYENDIRKGILEGDLSTYEDEQGNLSVKRNAPGLMVGVWEGQKLISENIKQAANYYVASQDEKIKILEEERMISSMQPMQETSTGSEIGQIGGNIVGQVLLAQAPRLIPYVGPLLGSAISSTYMGAMQAYNSEKEAYNLARDNNLNEFEAYDVAEKGRSTYYATGVAENFVSALVGARVGSAFKATASGASKGFGEAVKRFAKTTGTKSLEVGLDSSVAAIASAIRDAKTEETTGEDLDILDRALENAKMEAYAGGAMAVLGSAYGAGSKAVPKWLKSQAINMASTMEEPTLVNTVDNMKREGQLDQAQADQLLLDIKNWNTTTESNIDVPAEKAGVINGLTTKKQGLIDKLKTADESSVPAIQAEVASIDTQIAEARNNPDLLAGEVDDLTGETLIPKETTIQAELPIVEVDKIIKQKAKESTEDVANAASLVFKDAGYHVGELPGKSDYLQPGYYGEQPYTGYYFVSNPSQVVGRDSRFGKPGEFRIVDFSKYNMYKPGTEEYWETKSYLKKFVQDSDNFDKAYEDFIKNLKLSPVLKRAINDYNTPKQINSELYKLEKALETVKSNREFEQINNRIEELDNQLRELKGKDSFKENLKEELDSYNKKGWDKNQYGDESKERFETIILKMLGYEGVDVRGLKEEKGTGSPDRFSEGSVIFDLKPETVETLPGAYEKAKLSGSNPDLVNKLETIIKPKEDATQTTQEQQQGGIPEGNVSQRQRAEGEQDQATNEPDNRNRPVTGETQQEVTRPEVFSTQEQKNVFEKMRDAAEKQYAKNAEDSRGATQKAINILKNSDFYKKLDKNDREPYIAEATKYFSGISQTAPAVTKVLGTMQPNKITVNEMTALKRLLRFGEKSANTAFDFAKNKRIEISQGLKQLETRGKIGAKQFTSILAKYDKVNLKNPESIDRFVTYVSKVISDATFADKLSEAQRLRGLIKRAASIKTTQANLSSVARQFASINPLNVQDIGEYSKLASTVLEGVKSSRSTTDLVVKFNQAFSAPEIKSYTDKQKAFIETEAKNKKLADYQYLVDSGVLSGEMSLDEMDTLINDIESEVETAPLKDKERYVKAYVKERFDTLIAFAKDLLDKGQDEFGVISDKKISDADKKSVSQVLGIDITRLPLSDAYRVIESLDNFITNGETYGLDDILGRYEGNIKGDKLGQTFKKARPLSLFGSKDIGTFVAKQIETLPMVIYKMFRTDVATAKFLRESGIQSLFNNKNTAKLKANTMLNNFIKQFEGKKANGTDYNDAQNTVEQGILSFLRRNKGGSPAEVQALFETRKGLIQQGIDNLFSSGVDEDINKAELYQKVFDKVAKESNNITEVENNVDAVNKEVVDYWTNRWAENYEDLRGVSKSIYRQELDQDKAYNPDSYRKISKEQTQEDIDNYDPFNNSGFSFNYEGNIPKKMNGTLIKQKGIETMPEGKYLDLNFVSNSYKAMQSALTDIYTAKDVRTVKSMLDSDGLKKVINSKDLAVLKEKVALYVKRSRNMDAIDYDELSKLSKRLSDINRFITSASLGSLKQPIGQTFPLAIKTLIGAGRFDLADAASITANIYLGIDSPVNRFLNESGYGISVRGIESVANLQELSTLLSKTGGNIEKIGDLLNKRNDRVLKLLLSNPDAIIARASWLSYYKAELKAKGKDISNIDWDTHEIDTEAADIAQVNVDTQQNVSDADMQGKFMGSRKSATALMRNIVMPFSGFIMNSKAKMQADANTLISKVATSQEKLKAFRSMTGQFAEIAFYSVISSGATLAVKIAISEVFGGEESEREREKRAITMKKSLYTNLVDDGLSPLPPMANNAINAGVNGILDYFNADEPEETKIRLYQGTNKSTLENMTESAGMLGIGARKAIDFGTSLSYATKGEVKSNFAGKESIKYLSPEEKEMAAIGAVMQFLYLSRLVPIAEFGSMANNINRLVEKRALTEKQQDIKDLVGELAAETDGTKVDGKSVSDAISRAANFKDPEQRARYILGLRDKYGADVIEKMYPLLEESKILNAGTAANMRAILDKKPEEIKFSRLFSYTKQDARVQKLLELRNSYPNKQDFYDNLKWAFQFNILNEEGLSLLYDKLETIKDFTDEEFDMLVASVEE
jgi:hypothetical protein